MPNQTCGQTTCPSGEILLALGYRGLLPGPEPAEMIFLGTLCLRHLLTWALSANFLGLGQAVGKGIPKPG